LEHCGFQRQLEPPMPPSTSSPSAQARATSGAATPRRHASLPALPRTIRANELILAAHPGKKATFGRRLFFAKLERPSLGTTASFSPVLVVVKTSPGVWSDFPGAG